MSVTLCPMGVTGRDSWVFFIPDVISNEQQGLSKGRGEIFYKRVADHAGRISFLTYSNAQTHLSRFEMT